MYLSRKTAAELRTIIKGVLDDAAPGACQCGRCGQAVTVGQRYGVTACSDYGEPIKALQHIDCAAPEVAAADPAMAGKEKLPKLLDSGGPPEVADCAADVVCSKCGDAVLPEFEFCPWCGAAITASAATFEWERPSVSEKRRAAGNPEYP
jgi:hypothetical protein